MAPTFAANFKPSDAPLPRASMAFELVFSISILKLPEVFEFSVSGYIIFDITKAAGADITEAANKCPAIPGISDNHFT